MFLPDGAESGFENVKINMKGMGRSEKRGEIKSEHKCTLYEIPKELSMHRPTQIHARQIKDRVGKKERNPSPS